MHQRLGQHFLVNRRAVKTIIAALEIGRGDTVVEIGPGHGALTVPLAEACLKTGCKAIAIEKDPALAKTLGKNFQLPISNFQPIAGDALKILINNWILGIGNWKLCGNIPYYITGRLLRILSELEAKPKIAVLTLQKEVAERICAEPPKMNLLAAITQFWASPEIIGRLKAEDFTPRPNVESAIIKLTTRGGRPERERRISRDSSPPKADQNDAARYYKFIRLFFKQPRKTVFNNLRSGFGDAERVKENLLKYGLTGSERPQDLGLELLIKLAREFAK